MENNLLTVWLKPTYNTTAEKLGLGPDEIFENDPVLFQQGFDTIKIEVNPGDKFVISTKFEHGIIYCDDIDYKYWKRIDEDESYDEIDSNEPGLLVLSPGVYTFNTDGISIEKRDQDIIVEDFENESENEIENLISNTIANSAKRRFDFEDFRKDFDGFDENIADGVINTTLIQLASKENIKSISAKIHSEFLLIGMVWKRDEIEEFLKDKAHVFKIEIFVIQTVGQLLETGTNPLSVLDFVRTTLNYH